MSVMIVTYDLRKPGRNYEGLYEALDNYENCHALESSWFIDTRDDPAEVRDFLMKQIDSGDQLYVMRLRKHWAAARKESCTEWLKSSARTWD